MKSFTNTLNKSHLARFLTGAGGCLLVLVLQNVAIFWQHYIGVASFLNDFTRIYYPITAFWITLVQHGILPEWTPFANMGFPFVLTMQSGVFYPPLWPFALSEHFPYTLHAATVVQVLHVLLGAIGCWLYVHLIGRSPGVALFAAVAFQFFGGFYSNSEHVDIVRAYAYIPWLFWAVYLSPTQLAINGRNMLVPLIVMLFVTGVYQANVISHFFLLGIFILLSLFADCMRQKANRDLVIKNYLKISGLILLGIALSSVYLFPTVALKAYLARDGIWIGNTMNWPLSYWNSLIMASNADGLYLLPSMLSAFITVPVFCLLFLISPRFVKQNGLWVCITILAFAMASGTNLFVYRWVIDVLPLLGTSRFPSSDYRGILCFGLIILASGILDDYLNNKGQQKLLMGFVCCVGLLLFFYAGILFANWLSSPTATDAVAFVKQFNGLTIAVWTLLTFVSGNILSAENIEWPVVIGLSVLAFLSLHYFRHRPVRVLIALLLLEVVSGFYFINCPSISIYWRSDVATDKFYQELNSESPHAVMNVIHHSMEARPACVDTNLFAGSWRAYLLGDYMCQTQDSKTRPRETVNANLIISEYMRQTWQARLIQKEQLLNCQPENVIQANMAAVPVKSVAYRLQEVNYQVKAPDKFCFVENELLFPGWTGAIDKGDIQVQPQAYCGALRSWCLPEGEYRFTTRYHSPWLREGMIASLFFWVIYIVFYVRWFRLNRDLKS